MQPVQAWPPGAVGQWGSPFSHPWLVELFRYPEGMTIPKGVWMASCSHGASVIIRVNMALALEQTQQPALLTSIPPVVPLKFIPRNPPLPFPNDNGWGFGPYPGPRPPCPPPPCPPQPCVPPQGAPSRFPPWAPPWLRMTRQPPPPRPQQRITSIPDYYDDGGPNDWIVNHTVVHPCQTGTVWSDGWNVRLCGCGKALLIKVSQ